VVHCWPDSKKLLTKSSLSESNSIKLGDEVAAFSRTVQIPNSGLIFCPFIDFLEALLAVSIYNQGVKYPLCLAGKMIQRYRE
jgi:hypothetical protein